MNSLKPSKILPHRYPFLMLDDVVSVENGKATGIKKITLELSSKGLTFPQVLLIEALAQLSGVASGIEGQGMLVGIKEFTFHSVVICGDVLILESTLNKRFGNILDFFVSATVGNKRVLNGYILLSINA